MHVKRVARILYRHGRDFIVRQRRGLSGVGRSFRLSIRELLIRFVSRVKRVMERKLELRTKLEQRLKKHKNTLFPGQARGSGGAWHGQEVPITLS